MISSIDVAPKPLAKTAASAISRIRSRVALPLPMGVPSSLYCTAGTVFGLPDAPRQASPGPSRLRKPLRLQVKYALNLGLDHEPASFRAPGRVTSVPPRGPVNNPEPAANQA